MPFGQVLLPLAIVGAVRFGKRDGRLLTVLLMPLALSLMASLMGKYPYGGVRVSVFAAPALILCVAEGALPCWHWLRQRWQFAPAIIVAALGNPIWANCLSQRCALAANRFSRCECLRS